MSAPENTPLNPLDETIESLQIEVRAEDRVEFKRLDQFLAAKLDHFSRTTIKTLFTQELISFDDHSPIQGKLELKKMPQEGAIIEIQIPPPIESSLEPENIPLEKLFEDEHLVVIVKPQGLVTHPAPGHYTGTLVHAILFHCPDLKGVGEVRRPGIVHRLDKGTSGVMVVAKTNQAHEGLVNLFATHDIHRRYECLCLGHLAKLEGKLESTIGRHPQNRKKMAADVRGKKAITHFKRLAVYGDINHVECTLETGRTHQIRVHLSQLLNCPILMDELYGDPRRHLKHLPAQLAALLKETPHPFLHAKELGFVHPITKEKLFFSSPAPELFQTVLEKLK